MWGKASCLTKHRFKKNQTRTKEVTRLGYMAWTRHRNQLAWLKGQVHGLAHVH